MSKYRHTTSKEQRKEEIVKYLKKNPYQEEKMVLKFCVDKGIGSKVTVSDAITELLREGILNPGKERKNSKSYKLSVNSDNLLLTIPQDLEELLTRFKEFVKVVSTLHHTMSKIDEEQLASLDRYHYYSIQSIPSLPYDVIEIFNKIYLFYFRFVLPIKIKNHNTIDRLFSAYNQCVSKMHSFTSKEMNDYDWMNDLTVISKSLAYKSYTESDICYGFGLVKYLVRKCRTLNIESALFEFLDLLWIKNKEFLNLVYELNLQSEGVYDKYLTQLNKTYSDYAYTHNDLKKIHIQLDYYISEAGS